MTLPFKSRRPAYDANCLRQCTPFFGDSPHRVCIMSNFGDDTLWNPDCNLRCVDGNGHLLEEFAKA
jgi:hypothetical protein